MPDIKWICRRFTRFLHHGVCVVKSAGYKVKTPAEGPRRPVQKLRLGRTKAAVWANETQLSTRPSVTIVRLLKPDGEAA